MTVLRCGDLPSEALMEILSGYGIRREQVAPGAAIPGSYWGEPEAGLMADRLFLRDDTPVHSALHEACHLICMTPDRRAALQGDAGGDYQEESGVCYLQIVLSDSIPGLGRDRMFQDMDEWGYSFRLGSSSEWFRRDADDARAWLVYQGLLDGSGRPTWRMRAPEAWRAIEATGEPSR